MDFAWDTGTLGQKSKKRLTRAVSAVPPLCPTWDRTLKNPLEVVNHLSETTF